MSGDDFPSELRTLIPDELWHIRLQDKGCAKEKLPKQTYNKNKILGVGPLGEEVYYHGLSAIAIDYSKILANKKDLDQGWAQLPQNKTQVKDIFRTVVSSYQNDYQILQLPYDKVCSAS